MYRERWVKPFFFDTTKFIEEPNGFLKQAEFYSNCKGDTIKHLKLIEF